jgi:hypothetical protein
MRDSHTRKVLAIQTALQACGPLTTEDLRRALFRLGIVSMPSTLRKDCVAAARAREISSTIIKTKRYRMGVLLWSRIGESQEALAQAISALLHESAPVFRIGRLEPTPRVTQPRGWDEG